VSLKSATPLSSCRRTSRFARGSPSWRLTPLALEVGRRLPHTHDVDRGLGGLRVGGSSGGLCAGGGPHSCLQGAGRAPRRQGEEEGRAHGMCRWGGVWWEEIDKDRRGIFFLRVQNRVCCSVQMYLEGEKF
jgi:hypothetical protein